jgi:hypothetical protein
VNRWSPFAAVKLTVPVPVLFVVFTHLAQPRALP